jgi:predicted dehydrogenase
VRRFEGGMWSDLAPGMEPRPGAREPWAEANVETARHFLAALQGGSRGELGSLEDGATVQRLLAAAVASEEGGRRILLR